MDKNKIHEWINTILIIAVFILVLVGNNQSGQIGSTGTRFPYGISTNTTSPSTGEVETTTITVGSGTSIARVLHGTCTLTSYAAIAATTTQWHNCAVSGATTADRVVFGAPYGMQAGLITGLMYVNPRASSTVGYIGVEIYNNTGAATTSYPLATTSVPYWVYK